MPHNLIIRGFDDDIHAQLGDLSKQKGVSINSIVKDAVDHWLKQQNEIPKRHHLILYDNKESLQHLVKSLDYLTKDEEWFRCFVGSFNPQTTDLLKKLKWFEGTSTTYKSGQKDLKQYIFGILKNISHNAKNRQLCLIDFLINDIANSSVKDANNIEKEYDKDRLEGIVFCAYAIGNLINRSSSDMIELLNLHDQVFVLNGDQIYKLYLTKENIHKLLLS